MTTQTALRAGLALVILSGPSYGQSFDAVRTAIRTSIRDEHVPSVAVAVARKGAILWEEGFGYANQEKKIPASADTIYSIASLSKPFTATGLMTLVQAGKINLDAPINDYLGRAHVRAMVGNERDATVRRVANHTSGLPLHGHFFYQNERGWPPSTDETIRRYGLLVTAPGETWNYSNLGYGILGRVIELVSDRPYADFMDAQVFRPLRLTHSSIGDRRLPGSIYAVRYGSDGKPVANYTVDSVGASMVWASVHDLVRFGMFHAKTHLTDMKPILTDDLIEAMQVPGSGSASHYGIGWNVGEAKGYKVVAHGGDMEGVTSLLLILPSEQIVVAAVCNRRADVPGPIIDDIIEVLLPGWKARPAAPPTQPEHPLSRDLIGKWSGVLSSYSGKESFVLDIEGPKLAHAKIGSQAEKPVQNLVFDGTYLTGSFEGFIDTPDARIDPHNIGFSVRIRNGVLSGSATAFSRPPSGWMGNALTSWIEVRK